MLFLKVLVNTAVILFFMSHCLVAEQRPSCVAGQFYPDNPFELKKLINDNLNSVKPPGIKGRPIALIVPHAGYPYSARTASYGFKLIKGSNITTVILIGNSHHYNLTKAAVFSKGSFLTPLGEIKIDEVLAELIIRKTPFASANTGAHRNEHSLEVELPFLSETLGNYKIVPILLSAGIKDSEIKDISKAVSDSIKEKSLSTKTIIIASSDMSHYPSKKDAEIIDAESLKALESFDETIIKKTLDRIMSEGIPNLSCALCAKEAVLASVYISKALGADKAKILNYSNSGDVFFGDRKRVVGYGSVVFYNSKKSFKKTENKMIDFKISEKNQKLLLDIARQSITNVLKNKAPVITKSNDTELNTPSAVFVTLTINSNLRGCIGTTVPNFKLSDAVSYFAAAAAFEDHRFSPLSEKELKNTRIEISVLSPMKMAKNADEIKENIHGVVVKKGTRSGLFLPQVWEHFSNKEDFMNELCRQKAGLQPNAWETGEAEICTFTVFAFEE